MELSFADLLAGTEAQRDSIAARFLPPSDEADEEDPEGQQDEETDTEGQGSEAEVLSIEATERLIETMSQPGPPSALAPEEASDDGLEDETSTEGGRRTPARRTESLASQFQRSIDSYRDGNSAPRGLNEALRRKAKNVGVFGDNR